MKVITLKSASHWHELLNDFRKKNYKFRGQSDEKWELIPKAGRENYSSVNDETIFRQWKRRAKFYLQNKSMNDWEYLSIAQHTGLPTRFLDWSHNPMVALFFSCCENESKNGVVYISLVDKFVDDEKVKPFLIRSEILFYQPITSIERLANQYGYFSVHKNPSRPFEDENLIKIIIPKKMKTELTDMLNQYGINFLSLFPDLEGLSKHLSWFYEKKL
jgi:hypothetical protein